MCETQPIPCLAEWALETSCPHPVPEIDKPLRTAGYREQQKCYLHRNDNVVSKVLHLLTDRGYAVLMRCPDGCKYFGGPSGCGLTADARRVRMRQDTYCCDEVAAAVEVIRLAVEQLCARQANLAPQQFRQLADLTTARLIVRRLENHLAQHGVVEEIITTSERGERVTSGHVSSFLDGRLRLMALVRQHEHDLGLDLPCDSTNA